MMLLIMFLVNCFADIIPSYSKEEEVLLRADHISILVGSMYLLVLYSILRKGKEIKTKICGQTSPKIVNELVGKIPNATNVSMKSNNEFCIEANGDQHQILNRLHENLVGFVGDLG